MQSIFHSLLSSGPMFPFLRPHAYLDPGSGSFLIQLLIAGLVGAGFIIKASWSKIKAFFTRPSKKSKNTTGEPTEQE